MRPTRLALAFALLVVSVLRAQLSAPLTSPDGKLAVTFDLNADGAPRYSVTHGGATVLRTSKLGLVRDDAGFTRGLKLVGISPTETVHDQYETLTAKRRLNTYTAQRRVYHLATSKGTQSLDIIFQVSNDGVAFRYAFPEKDTAVHRLAEEVTSFHFPTKAHAWLQPMSVAKTGWEKVNPCYEEYYQKDIPVGTPSTLGAGWVYPALFHAGDVWIALTEGSLERNYCGTRLRSESPDGEYSVGFPDPRENFQNGPVTPESTLPWITPWRIVTVGSLKTIVESTLGLDLAAPPSGNTQPAHPPGKAAWSWPLLGDKKTTYDVQKRFIDYAADMHWRYCLIDSMWDQQIGYEKIRELADYAHTKNVSLLLWYNSAGDWNSAPQTPRGVMLTHESRVREFARLKEMGIAGIKVDFFGGDGQSMIGYYHDIIADAAPYGLLLNFHGATLPRGWSRTFPNVMTTEAIKGLEFITFEQKNADEEPAHAAMLPFTRNLFDPMDFTPMVLDRINSRIQRRTTPGFELALSVLFISGIQHYAEIPEGMAKAPDYVREFLRNVPESWDETRFLDGFPGQHVVLARHSGARWWISGINSLDTPKDLQLDLAELKLAATASGDLIADGDGGNLSFRRETLVLGKGGPVAITMPARGGFVIEIR